MLIPYWLFEKRLNGYVFKSWKGREIFREQDKSAILGNWKPETLFIRTTIELSSSRLLLSIKCDEITSEITTLPRSATGGGGCGFASTTAYPHSSLHWWFSNLERSINGPYHGIVTISNVSDPLNLPPFLRKCCWFRCFNWKFALITISCSLMWRTRVGR